MTQLQSPVRFGRYQLVHGRRNSQPIWLVYRDGELDPLAERQSREQAVRFIERHQRRDAGSPE